MDDPRFRFHRLAVSGGTIFAAEIGDHDKPPIVFLHGWPQNWMTWRRVMLRAGETHRAIAIDLPGIGHSTWPNASGSKRAIADAVHGVIEQLGLRRVTLVGHDIGGQVVYAYLTQYDRDIDRAAIVDVVIPGVEPWDDVLRNPYIWHFAFHAIPNLPEALVAGKQDVYFDYFYNAIAARPEALDAALRRAFADAYREEAALETGFAWYRAFAQDAKDNRAFGEGGGTISSPLFYIRGAKSYGDIDAYEKGFRAAGVRSVTTNVIENSGHFIAEEQPDALWASLSTFLTPASVLR